MNSKNRIFSDLSLWALILTNLASMIFAVFQDWNLYQMIWIYWSQSVIIGVTHYFRLSSLEKTQNTDLSATNFKTSLFFAAHYGLFHFGYFVFLIAFQVLSISETTISNLPLFITLIISFLGTHLFSYTYNKKDEFKGKNTNIRALLFYPYFRVIPMHIIVIIGFFIPSTSGVVIFIALKTLADVGTHIFEHRFFRSK